VDENEELAPTLEVAQEAPRSGTRVLALRGELDVATVGRFRDALHAAIEDQASHIVVDLSEVTFIDSTGLMTLLNGLRRLMRRDGKLAIVCSNPTVLRLFEVTRTDATFEIFPNRELALASLGT
jgi:anti-sigma B factor antagonist